MSRFMHIVRHRITLLLVAIVALIGALQLAAPTLIRAYALHWLKGHGVAHAKIDRIRLNPWLGRLSVQGLQAGAGLSVGRAAIDIDWWPVWHHHIYIRMLSVEHAKLKLVQQADGSWAPSGLTLARSTDKAQGGRPWQAVLRRIDLKQVHIVLAGRELRADIPIEHMTLTLASMSRTDAQVLNVDMQFGQGFVFAGNDHATISSLRLGGQFMLPATADTTSAAGGRHIAIRVQGLSLQASKGQAALAVGKALIYGIAMQGPENLVADGIDANVLRLTSLPGGIEARADAAVAGTIRLRHGRLDIGGLKLDHMRADAPDGLSLGVIKSLAMDGLSVTGTQHAAFSQLMLHGIDLPATADQSLGHVDGITATGGEFASPDHMQLDRLDVQGLNLTLQHGKDGMAVLNRLKTISPPAASTATPSAPADIRIGLVTIDKGSRISLTDHAVRPPFRNNMEVESFRLSSLDLGGKQPGSLDAAFKLGDQGQLTVKGDLEMKRAKPAANLTLAIRRLSLPMLSGYVERDFGSGIKTGQMDLDSQVHIRNDTIDAQNKLVIRSLELAASTQPGKDALNLGMPLDMAVRILRDDNGDIALDVPVTGRLDNPDFHLSDAFDQALTSAMRSAAFSYATMLLQPYGSIMPAISMVAGMIGQAAKPRLTPIVFAPRSTALSEQAQAYVARIALLMKKKDFRLQVCGVAAGGDFLAGTAPTPGSSAYNNLLTLASGRSSQIIKALVAAGGDPAHLFSCRPQVDARGKEGRVELLLD